MKFGKLPCCRAKTVGEQIYRTIATSILHIKPYYEGVVTRTKFEIFLLLDKNANKICNEYDDLLIPYTHIDFIIYLSTHLKQSFVFQQCLAQVFYKEYCLEITIFDTNLLYHNFGSHSSICRVASDILWSL